MSVKYRMIAVDEESIELLQKCKEEFVKHHPELKNIPISKRKIVKEVAEYYLRT